MVFGTGRLNRGGSGLLVLSATDVEELLEGPELVPLMSRALVAYSAGEADVPPRIAARCPRGLLGAMAADLAPAALAVKLVSVFPDNPKRALPSHQGLLLLFDRELGQPLCVMDARRITAQRTAAVSALSVRALAPPGSTTLAILGSGAQARAHLELVPGVVRFAEVRLWARRPEGAQQLARGMSTAIRVCDSAEAAVRGAQVVVCCTDARQAIVPEAWLEGPVHLVSVGTGPELAPSVLARARLFVEWRGAVTNPAPAGAAEIQAVDPAAVTELGEVLSGLRPGRNPADVLTVFKSTGLAVEDAAVAAAVYERAAVRGIGTVIPW